MERRKSVYNVICPVCNCSNVKIALTANIFVLPMEYLSGVMRNDNHFRFTWNSWFMQTKMLHRAFA